MDSTPRRAVSPVGGSCVLLLKVELTILYNKESPGYCLLKEQREEDCEVVIHYPFYISTLTEVTATWPLQTIFVELKIFKQGKTE